ncbi:MAG: hypothetical protein PGN34_05410 [Methylobacterium frigidaeris]
MHRYYFDLEADGVLARDEIGIVLADAGAARIEAAQALSSCAGGLRHRFSGLALRVRDESGRTILHLTAPAAA